MNTHQSFAWPTLNATNCQFCLSHVAATKRRRVHASLFLSFLLLLTLPAVVQAQFTFTTNNGAITITGYTGPGGAVIVPDTINGLPVISIGDSAFELCSSLTSFTIPNSATSIGKSAFDSCTSLTNVIIGTNLTTIGDDAFYNCLSLTGLSIPNSLTTIGDFAFYDCFSLTSLNIPNSVTNIGDFAFSMCSGLTNITIPNSVISIGGSAFSICTGLINITIPNSVTIIGVGAFSECISLRDITVDALNSDYTTMDGVLFNKGQTTLIAYPPGKAEATYTIPSSVISIGDDAFEFCIHLTSISIPNSVTSIGDHAFDNCTSLTNVTIGDNVNNIGGAAFAMCSSLTKVTIPNSVSSIGEVAFLGCTGLTGVYFQGNAPFPTSPYVFANDTEATIFYLPGTSGWSFTYGGRPALLWNPQMQTSAASLGVRTNPFGFTISGTTNIPIVVEVGTNLAASWTSLQTCTLTNGSIYFSDPDWTNYPARFYRLRSP